MIQNSQSTSVVLRASAIAAVVLGATSAWAAEQLTVQVGYGFGGDSSSRIYSANPDTGYVQISNTGDNRFVGSFSLTGSSGFGGFGHIEADDHTPISFSLAPGDTWTLLGTPEGSNYGGFNKCQTWVDGDSNSGQDPKGVADSGLFLRIVGTLGTAGAIDYGIYDHEIHSGTPAQNPFGVTLDNYILQGGDPFGRDTGDAFEVSQAAASFTVTGSRTGVPIQCLPETGDTALIFAGGILATALIRRKLGA